MCFNDHCSVEIGSQLLTELRSGPSGKRSEYGDGAGSIPGVAEASFIYLFFASDLYQNSYIQ